MAEGLQLAGFSKIYCTPHLIKGFYEADTDSIRNAVVALQARLKEENIALELLPGREYYLDEFIYDFLRDPLPLGQTGLIMIEIPAFTNGDLVKDVCFHIRSRGFRPMIAHPERGGVLLEGRDGDMLRQYLREIDCAFQVNMRSFTDRYGPSIRENAERLLREKIYTHFGTDLHSLQGLAGIERISQ